MTDLDLLIGCLRHFEQQAFFQRQNYCPLRRSLEVLELALPLALVLFPFLNFLNCQKKKRRCLNH